jgi:hypothetical protein
MMADLHTRYLGLKLRSPLVASASPLTGSLDGLRRLEAAGAAAVVLPSLFEEQLTLEAEQVARLLEGGAESLSAALDLDDQRSVRDPAAWERANYITMLASYPDQVHTEAH